MMYNIFTYKFNIFKNRFNIFKKIKVKKRFLKPACCITRLINLCIQHLRC